ncbi:hypothetical protein D3C84_732900 [compost metagenome]
MTQAWLDMRMFQRRQVLGAGTEGADPFAVDQVEQTLGAGMQRRAVVEHQCGADCQATDQPVPHHPAAGGVVEQHVVRAQVVVQAVFLQVLQQHTASTVHDALGHAGGAAGVKNVQRLVEGQRGELRFATGLIEVVPETDAGSTVKFVSARTGTAVRHYQQVFKAGQLCQHLVDFVDLVDVFTGVLITTTGYQQLGLDLAEAVNDAVGAELR